MFLQLLDLEAADHNYLNLRDEPQCSTSHYYSANTI